MSLAKLYCKEIAQQLRLNPVYPPGINVAPGDVINFDDDGIFKNKPQGPFKKVTDLATLGINLTTESDTDPYSYIFTSKNGVSTSFSAEANAGNAANGKLTVSFSREGATYLSAVDCKQTRFSDISNLETLLEPHRNRVDWKECFIVIAVTTAAKALIMQSSTSSAKLEIDGEVKGLQPVPGANLLQNNEVNASLSLRISKYNDASFIKDWSSNVPVFFQVVRYRKQLLGGWDVKSARPELLLSDDDKYAIEWVNPAELALD